MELFSSEVGENNSTYSDIVPALSYLTPDVWNFPMGFQVKNVPYLLEITTNY